MVWRVPYVALLGAELAAGSGPHVRVLAGLSGRTRSMVMPAAVYQGMGTVQERGSGSLRSSGRISV